MIGRSNPVSPPLPHRPHQLAPLLALLLLGACAGQHRTLRYTPELQALEAAGDPEKRHLTPGEPVDSILGTVDLLLGPAAEELTLDHTPVDDDAVRAAVASPPLADDAVLAYRFIHIGDIQLRDRGNGVGEALERAVDKRVRWTQNNAFQDHADVFYLAFMLRATRALLDDGSHQFAIHAGDSMHMATTSELEAFTRLTERFLMYTPAERAPCASCWIDHGWLTARFDAGTADAPRPTWFLNTIGNHDVLRWGNWTRDADELVRAYPTDIASRAELADAVVALARASAPAGAPPVRVHALVDRALPLAPPAAALPPGEPVSYYAIDLPLPPAPGAPAPGKLRQRHARIVVLDPFETSPPAFAGIRADLPAISRAQRDWLDAVLADADRDDAVDHTLVFAHAPLWTILVRDHGDPKGKPGELEQLLCAHPSVIAYLSGHWHSGVPAGRKFVERKGYPFAHFTHPSMMEFPKVFMSVAVERRGDGSYRIRTRPHALDELGLAPAPPGAERPSVDIHQPVAGRHQAAFTAWIEALAGRCGDDPACRAAQLARDCMAAARLDRGTFTEQWESSRRDEFIVDLTVERPVDATASLPADDVDMPMVEED